ncbi:hypothetical protein P7K49_023438 [Saguinus oedipus]|uniref:Uncharacterized protein n=1 Tax=Saguinus oedipus TaxID=9490 RepID=A0ABQ9UNY3_SAGOE|nr:hypothetical protein P7K49_023438 [Saguinus oedipus]
MEWSSLARALDRGAVGPLFQLPKRGGCSSGGKGSAYPSRAKPAPGAPTEPAAQEEETGGPAPKPPRQRTQSGLGSREGPDPPLAPGLCGSRLPGTWSDLAEAPALAAGSRQRYNRSGPRTCRATRTHFLRCPILCLTRRTAKMQGHGHPEQQQ